MSIEPAVNDARNVPRGAFFGVVIASGVMGAAGVILAAVAAHRLESPTLATSATFLMVHAGVALAVATLGLQMQSSRRWLITAGFMLAAVALFSGAVAYHAVTGTHVFPRAAPTGGALLIASWCAIAVLGCLEALKKR